VLRHAFLPSEADVRQPREGHPRVSWYFFFFFLSGFCAVLYELVWLRLGMAQFGVTTAMVSIVLSVFMAGMGLGSWASGRWLRRRETNQEFRALRLYALIELLIGASGIAAPYELLWGRHVLTTFGVSSSLGYYVAAGLWVAGTLAPWCALMGATIPVAMRAIAQMFPQEAARSFSYLYMANVAGAVLGTAAPLVLIELFGFGGTLRVGVACNAVIALAAMAMASFRVPSGAEVAGGGEAAPAAGETLRRPDQNSAVGEIAQVITNRTRGSAERGMLVLLFLTGMTSMGMEVVWVRQFTPYLGTVVYAFASILAAYLAATFLGARAYRWWGARHSVDTPMIWTLLALSALFALVTASPMIHMWQGPRLMLGVMPFTGLLGLVTPMLVDRFSGGDPGKAGAAYAINVVGCILGPLMAGFGLLPNLTERWALVVLASPWLIFGMWTWQGSDTPALRRGMAVVVLALVAAGLIAAGRGYEEMFPERLVLRDSTATVVATGKGMEKRLLVNGYGMTTLTPVTKMMAHLPLAFLDRPPESALDICFGMGTTFRSLMSWKIRVTAVELVPSVPRAFGYFHSDGPALLSSSLGHVVIDDGRRYLERPGEQYDLITIDPPPPVEAAGSSLLYSEEFYVLAKRRLKTGGILAQWLPNGDAPTQSAVARALKDSFPYVRLLRWKEDWGMHFFASDYPLPQRSAEELLGRMPDGAVADLTEWFEPAGSRAAGVEAVQALLDNEMPLDEMIARSPATPALRDDRPINEYYRVRKALRGKRKKAQAAMFQKETRVADFAE
jgi:predicted membrane-bound spermidine synthase